MLTRVQERGQGIWLLQCPSSCYLRSLRDARGQSSASQIGQGRPGRGGKTTIRDELCNLVDEPRRNTNESSYHCHSAKMYNYRCKLDPWSQG
jgi:hypothetical protein